MIAIQQDGNSYTTGAAIILQFRPQNFFFALDQHACPESEKRALGMRLILCNELEHWTSPSKYLADFRSTLLIFLMIRIGLQPPNIYDIFNVFFVP